MLRFCVIVTLHRGAHVLTLSSDGCVFIEMDSLSMDSVLPNSAFNTCIQTHNSNNAGLLQLHFIKAVVYT